MIDPLLLSVTKVSTFKSEQLLTNASGFFFARDETLFLVTSRHVLCDEISQHFPDAIRIKLHTDENNFTEAVDFLIPLYQDGKRIWRQSSDSTGDVDVAVIEIDQDALPVDVVYSSFNIDRLMRSCYVEIGSALLVIGFPPDFRDTLHDLPITRHGIVASCFDLRYQGYGYFLTDARTHRGMSGAPVVMRSDRDDNGSDRFPWTLAGIHAARMDVGTRDLQLDEVLGLNCAWFSDILTTLTDTVELYGQTRFKPAGHDFRRRRVNY